MSKTPIRVPTWLEACDAVDNGTATPLDVIVFNNDPAGTQESCQFVTELTELIEYIRGLP